MGNRMCPYCNSTNIIYPDKIYAKCEDCGALLPRTERRIKIKVKPLSLGNDLFVKYNKRNIGNIHDKRYITHRNKIHFVRKYKGFGITLSVFNKIKNIVDKIVIIYTKMNGTQEVYYSNIKDWETHGIRDKLGGFEEQIFLPTKYMNVR